MTDIKFLCPAELSGKIPQPARASKFLPDWFRGLPREMDVKDEHGLTGLTVKACLPVTDIMSLGWIIPLPVDIRAGIHPKTGQFNFHWDETSPFKPLDMHHPGQIGSDKPGPFAGAMPFKFLNPWRVVLPAGWSAQFLHPINHLELPFRAFNGAVDCDSLDVPVNVPFLWMGGGEDTHLRAGTPMVQVVPYQRSAMRLTSDIRAETQEETAVRATALGRKYSEESVYAREWRRRHERES